MAAGMFKKAMLMLGLTDEYDDDYDDYDQRAPVTPRVSGRAHPDEIEPEPVTVASTIRPIVREDASPATSVASVNPRPTVARPATSEIALVHVVAPTQFGDARQIADRLMSNQPVIVNLQVVAPELMRRIIDFCSGVTYSLSGKMERVAQQVFLLTPSNVKVSAEERQRLQDNGLLRPGT